MMPTRREFLGTAAALGASLSLTPIGAGAFRAPKKVLILGGTGFIGPHIVHAALAGGHHVTILNRGQREPNQNAGDFARVEALRGDRNRPDAYQALAGRTWDAVIDTATRLAWTREALAALKGRAGRFMYVSSTGVFLPYLTTDIPEDGPVRLTDTPPQDPPSYGVLKAQSERDVRDAFGAGALLSYTMEVLQHGLPVRVPSLLDWIANAGGTALGVALSCGIDRLGGGRRDETVFELLADHSARLGPDPARADERRALGFRSAG